MIGDYAGLTKFVRSVIIEPCLPFNHLKTTTSAVRSILNGFHSKGWSSKEIADEKVKNPRYKLVSPGGEIELVLNSSKVSRHPLHTEQICQRKHLTKRMLDLAELPSPAGADFSRREKGVARAYFEKLPKPVVIKPTNSGGSHGVTIGVFTLDDFEHAWKFAIDEAGADSNVLIEQFVHGFELRAFVVGDEAVSIVARIQPYVVGDGVAEFDALVEGANEARKVHYRATELGVVVDWDFIGKQGHSHDSVPAKDEIVYLTPLALPASGALLVDVTDSVAEGIKALAVSARRAVPDLEVAGVDILVGDLDDVSSAVILEINTAPSLNLHRFVTHGKPRDVEQDVVVYFQERYQEEASTAAVV